MKHYSPHHNVSISPEYSSPIIWHPGTQLMLGQQEAISVKKLASRSYPDTSRLQEKCATHFFNFIILFDLVLYF